MADPQYGLLLTQQGASDLVAAQVTGIPVPIAFMAVGDGNGAEYDPTDSQTALKNELIRIPVDSVTQDPVNPPWIDIVATIPGSTGGFFVREVGIFTQSGRLLAVGRYPSMYKPVPESGFSLDQQIKSILQIGNAANVTFVVDASQVYATHEWVFINRAFIPVISATRRTPPTNPAPGDHYLVPTGSGLTGAFAGQGGKIMLFRNSIDLWLPFLPPQRSVAAAQDSEIDYRLTPRGWRPANSATLFYGCL